MTTRGARSAHSFAKTANEWGTPGYDARNRLTSKQTPFGTLSYTYDSGGDLLTLKSSNTHGISDTYTCDVLNRLSTVTDPAGATTYPTTRWEIWQDMRIAGGPLLGARICRLRVEGWGTRLENKLRPVEKFDDERRTQRPLIRKGRE